MAEITPQERLQPCLLDRLTDDDPEHQLESRDQRIISMRRYKQGVLRDLSWLFNTSSHVSDGMLDDFAEASHSVINFGLPDLCGLTATSLRSTEMEMRLLEAIHFFEPRIIPQSLNIDIHNNPGEMSHNAFSFEIRGELWAHPLPDSLFVRTEVDLETGQCNLEE